MSICKQFFISNDDHFDAADNGHSRIPFSYLKILHFIFQVCDFELKVVSFRGILALLNALSGRNG